MKKALYTPRLVFILCFILPVACASVPSTPTPAPTAAPRTTATIAPTVTAIPSPTPTLRPSPSPNLAATAQYAGMQVKVKELLDAGYISRATGSYVSIEPYSDYWAQIDWYTWSPVPETVPADFIVRTEIAWESASKTPNLSGCGFVFRLQPNKDHYMIHIGTDGYIYAASNLNGHWAEMGHAYYGKGQFNGHETLTLIVEKDTFSILINDKFIKKFTGFKANLLDGTLAYTIISGSNTDFGTRCSFSNTELWKLK